MAMSMPKFMENENWFYYDEEEFFIFKLTKEAPEEVYKSYKIYLEDCLINGQIDDIDYEYLVKELDQFDKEKVNSLFGV
jgi:hypothetical protein